MIAKKKKNPELLKNFKNIKIVVNDFCCYNKSFISSLCTLYVLYFWVEQKEIWSLKLLVFLKREGNMLQKSSETCETLHKTHHLQWMQKWNVLYIFGIKSKWQHLWQSSAYFIKTILVEIWNILIL